MKNRIGVLSSKLVVSIVAILFLILAVLIYLLTKPSNDYPADSAGVKVNLVVSTGEFGSQIAQDAKKLGIVKDSSYLTSLLIKEQIKNIAPGTHQINQHLPAKQAITQLIDPKLIIDQITIKPGENVGTVINKLKNIPSISFAGFHYFGDGKSNLKLKLPISNKLESLEGQLGTATYSFSPNTKVSDVLSEMLLNFQNSPSAKLLSEIDTQNFGDLKKTLLKSGIITPKYAVLIVASLLQLEGDPVDFGKVARVIYNRLALGMPLQLNSTVAYGLGLKNQIAMSVSQTKSSNSYNTYLNLGLPPTPINNPSLEAIQAALKPEVGDWLYFVTIKPGVTKFSNNYPTFLKYKQEFEAELAKGSFK